MAKCPTCKGFGYVNRFGSFDGSMEMQCPRCHGMFVDPHASPKITKRGGARASGGNGGSILLLLALGGGWFWIQSQFGGMDAFKDSAATTIEKVFAFVFYGLVLPGIVLVNLFAAFHYARWRYWNLPRWILNAAIFLVVLTIVWWVVLTAACGLLGWTLPGWLIRNAALVIGGGSALIALVNLGERCGAYGHAWDLVLRGNAGKRKRILHAMMPLTRVPKGLKLSKDALQDPFVSAFFSTQILGMVMGLFPDTEKQEQYVITEEIRQRIVSWSGCGQRGAGPALSDDEVERERERGRCFATLFLLEYHTRDLQGGKSQFKDEYLEWAAKNAKALSDALGEARWRNPDQRRAYIVERCWKPELERLKA